MKFVGFGAETTLNMKCRMLNSALTTKFSGLVHRRQASRGKKVFASFFIMLTCSLNTRNIDF
jgi:hypothetical protein